MKSSVSDACAACVEGSEEVARSRHLRSDIIFWNSLATALGGRHVDVRNVAVR